MKVTFVSPYVYSYFDSDDGPPPGGAQRQQFLVSKELIDRGHDVVFVVGDYGQESPMRVDGIQLIKGAPAQVNGPVSAMKKFHELFQTLSSLESDVLVTRGSPRLALVVYLISTVLREPFVYRLANDADVDRDYLEQRYSMPARYLYKRTLRGASYIMAQTNQQQQALARNFGIDSSVVPNAYDIPPESDIMPHRDRESILWVGSSDPEQKKPKRFLQLAEKLPDQSFKMISQPLPNQQEHHKELREKARTIQNISFLGEVPPDEIHQHYRSAKILVNTSEYEGFPNTFLEAWRYETPVVSLHFDFDNLLEDRRAGILSGTMAQLIEDVENLSNNVELRSQIGKTARQLVIDRFSLQEMADNYEEVFRRASQDYK